MGYLNFMIYTIITSNMIYLIFNKYMRHTLNIKKQKSWRQEGKKQHTMQTLTETVCLKQFISEKQFCRQEASLDLKRDVFMMKDQFTRQHNHPKSR